MPNNNTFFFYNNTHQNTTQETDHPSTLKITLGIIGTVVGMIIVGAYFYLSFFEQNRVAPSQAPEPPHDPETRYEPTQVIPFDTESPPPPSPLILRGTN